MPRTTTHHHRSVAPTRAWHRRPTLVVCAVGALLAVGSAVAVQAADGSASQAFADTPVRTSTDPAASRDAERPALALAAHDVADDVSAAADELRADEEAAAQRQRAIDAAIEDPRSAARAMLADFGWSDSQFGCLDRLWTSESGWNHRAANPSSGAYGIPQALPGSKMGTVAADWQSNPLTQIRWGLGYIRDAYGSPCSAMSFKSGRGWY